MSIDYSHEAQVERDMENQNDALWEIVKELREIKELLKTKKDFNENGKE